MKRLLLSPVLSMFVATTLLVGSPGTITDGNSLADGIAVFRRAEAKIDLTDAEMMMVAATVAYLNGFLASSRAWSASDKASPFKLPDEGIPVTQMIRIMEKYIADNPAKLSESAGILVLVALKESFPNPVYKK